MRCKKKSKEVLWLLKPAFQVNNDKNPSFKHERPAKLLDYVILLHYPFFLSLFFFFFKISSMTCEFMKNSPSKSRNNGSSDLTSSFLKWLCGKVAGNWCRDQTVLCWGRELARKGEVPLRGLVLTEGSVGTLKV